VLKMELSTIPMIALVAAHDVFMAISLRMSNVWSSANSQASL
jgi:hypothetical protein